MTSLFKEPSDRICHFSDEMDIDYDLAVRRLERILYNPVYKETIMKIIATSVETVGDDAHDLWADAGLSERHVYAVLDDFDKYYEEVAYPQL